MSCARPSAALASASVHKFLSLFLVAAFVLLACGCGPERPAPPPTSARHPAHVEGPWKGRDDKRWSFVIDLGGPVEGFAATARVSDPRQRGADYRGTWGETEGVINISLLRVEAEGARGPQWFHLSGLVLPRDTAIELTSRDDTCSCTTTVRLAR